MLGPQNGSNIMTLPVMKIRGLSSYFRFHIALTQCQLERCCSVIQGSVVTRDTNEPQQYPSYEALVLSTHRE